ncbi:MAG: radical SAM protein [Candidatus Bathyarchaeota archaeon]|nr:radical SAM protein [Candidatus Bathyarchaeota archaeon]
MSKTSALPELVRVSVGSAIVLGLAEGKLDASPTTAYLMTHHTGKCVGNCGFCPQARGSQSKTELLSRVIWPTFPTQNVLSALAKAVETGKIYRVCIQALNYPEVFLDLYALITAIKSCVAVPVSVSCQPLNTKNIQLLKPAGADRIGIALDAATPELFDIIKGEASGGCYRWDDVLGLLEEALAVFGVGNVSTHLIVGLGETEKEAVQFIQKCVDLGVLPALFAFTPVRGTAMETHPPPNLGSYRRVQLARYLIVNGKGHADNFVFDEKYQIASFGLNPDALNSVVERGAAFQTSGCPNCNRPFYNEKPSGPIYNYPWVPTKKEIEKIKADLASLI